MPKERLEIIKIDMRNGEMEKGFVWKDYFLSVFVGG